MELAVPEAVLDEYHFKDGRFVGRWDWRSPRDGYRGGELAIERLWLRKGAGTLSVSGRMAEGGILDFVTIADKMAVRDTEGLRERMPSVSGSLAFTGTVKGTAEKPRADLELVGTGLTLNGDPLGDGRAYVRLTDRATRGLPKRCMEGRRAAGRRRLRVRSRRPGARTMAGRSAAAHERGPPAAARATDGLGRVRRGARRTGRRRHDDRSHAGDAAARPTRAARLEFGKLLPPRARTLAAARRDQRRGPAAGRRAARTGDARRQARDCSELRAGQLDVELRNHGPLDIDFGHGAFEVKSAELVGASSKLAITGGGSLQNGLGLSVDGSVDLGLLTSLSQTVSEAEGSVALAFKVTGRSTSPTSTAPPRCATPASEICVVPQAVREVNGDITFSARRIVLEGFSAKVAGGEVGWSGAAELEGRSVGSYALQIDASGLSLEPREGVSLKLGGKGELSWKRRRLPVLHGKLRVDDFLYTRPIKMNRTIDEMPRPNAARPPATIPSSTCSSRPRARAKQTAVRAQQPDRRRAAARD